MRSATSLICLASSFSTTVALTITIPAAATSNSLAQSLERHSTASLGNCQGFDCFVQYVNSPDSSYSWYDTKVQLRGTDAGTSAKWIGYILNMTSQTWEHPAGLDFPLWWHTMIVVVPANREIFDWSTIMLEFGVHLSSGDLLRISNRPVNEWPQDSAQNYTVVDAEHLESRHRELQQIAEKAASLASRTRAIVTVVLNIPNEYETFRSDPSAMRRFTDYLKSYTYLDFIEHPDEPERICELPHAKAGVRALDTVEAFTASLPGGGVSRFGIVGYSKLGTLTWVLGALDRRVEAIVPAAIFFSQLQQIDTSKLPPAMHPKSLHSAKKPDTFVETYIDMLNARGLPAFERLQSIIDPARWEARLNVTKMYIVASNDHIVHNAGRTSEIYLSKMPGHTATKMVPNCLHDEAIVNSLDTVAAFLRGFLLGKTMPKIRFEYSSSQNRVVVRTGDNHEPVKVRQWVGSTSSTWTHVVLASRQGEDRQWISSSDWPSVGNTDMFVEVEYEWPEPGMNFVITTPEFAAVGS